MEQTEGHHIRALMARFIRRRWRVPVQLLAATTALMLVFGIAVLLEDEAPEPAAPRPLPAGGVVESLYSRDVGSAFEGPVGEIAVREGQAVKKGQPLFRMDTAWLKSSLDGAKAERAAAQTALRETRAARDAEVGLIHREMHALRGGPIAAGDVDGEQPSDFEEGAVSADPPLTPDEVALSLDAAGDRLGERTAAWRPALDAAAARVAAAEPQVKRFAAMLSQAERRSPITGIVTAVYATPGESVSAAQPVLRVDNPAGYRVVSLMDKQAMSHIRKGARVPLEQPDGRARGRVEKVVAGWDKELFRYWVWVKPEERRGLRPGDSVSIAIPAGTIVAAR